MAFNTKTVDVLDTLITGAVHLPPLLFLLSSSDELQFGVGLSS